MTGGYRIGQHGKGTFQSLRELYGTAFPMTLARTDSKPHCRATSGGMELGVQVISEWSWGMILDCLIEQMNEYLWLVEGDGCTGKRLRKRDIKL